MAHVAETEKSSPPTQRAGRAIIALGQEFLQHQQRRARKHREKYLAMPYYWWLSRNLTALGRRVVDGAQDQKTPEDAADFILKKVANSGLRMRLRSDALVEALHAWTDTADQETGERFEAHIRNAMLSEEDPANKFYFLQALGRVEEAIDAARTLDNSRLGRRDFKHFRKQPGSWYLATDLIPPRPTSQPSLSPERIAYVAASSLPHSTAGYATRTQGVAQAYQALGVELEVVTRPAFPFTRSSIAKAKSHPQKEVVDGVTYHRLFAPVEHSTNRLDFLSKAPDALEAKLRELRPDYVVAGSNYANALPALIAARRMGLPFAYEVRGFWELTRASTEPGFETTPEFAAMVALESRIAREADRVLTLTQPMFDTLIERGVEPDRLALMPNGVEESFISEPPREAALAEELGITDQDLVIGYAGSIVEYEGLDDLAQACVGLIEKGHNIKLLIVGDERSRQDIKPITQKIKSVFASAGHSDRLIMPGRVPFDQVSRYYGLMTVTPIPRKPFEVAEKVSPIKPVEALAMGKTLVVSSVAALLDFAQDGRTGLVFEKGNVAALEETLGRAVSDPELRARLKEAGLEFVRSQRTWPAICRAALDHLGP